jgi:hypothetical protein
METTNSATSIRVPWNKGKLATADESDADIQTYQEPAGRAIATRAALP